jgi:hypothetical protein
LKCKDSSSTASIVENSGLHGRPDYEMVYLLIATMSRWRTYGRQTHPVVSKMSKKLRCVLFVYPYVSWRGGDTDSQEATPCKPMHRLLVTCCPSADSRSPYQRVLKGLWTFKLRRGACSRVGVVGLCGPHKLTAAALLYK